MTSKSSSANQEPSQFYGRRLGRPLSASRQNALDALLPLLGVPEDDLDQRCALAPTSLFENAYKSFVLEIGFGDGKRLIEDMKRSPTTGFIGVEPFINGMSSFLKDVLDVIADN